MSTTTDDQLGRNLRLMKAAPKMLKAIRGLLQVLGEAEIVCRFSAAGGCESRPDCEPCEMCAAWAVIAEVEERARLRGKRPPTAPREHLLDELELLFDEASALTTWSERAEAETAAAMRTRAADLAERGRRLRELIREEATC